MFRFWRHWCQKQASQDVGYGGAQGNSGGFGMSSCGALKVGHRADICSSSEVCLGFGVWRLACGIAEEVEQDRSNLSFMA